MTDLTRATTERADIEATGSEAPDDGRYDAFISYSRSDRDRVRDLVAALAVLGKRCWVDLEDIPPSAEWMSEIRSAIDSVDAYLVAISPGFAGSKVCAVELDHARTAGKRIVPVLVRPTDPESVPGELGALNWIDAADPNELDRAAAAVVQAIDQDLDHVKAHTRLLVRAGEWERAERDRSLLLRGRELREAEQLLSVDRDPKVTPLQTRFVVASRKAATARQRGAISVVTVAFMLAAVLGVVALMQRDRAVRNGRTANARELAAAAQARIDVAPRDALQLAVRGFQVERTRETTAALTAALQADNELTVLRASEDGFPELFAGPEGEREIPTVESVAAGTDGRTVYTGGGDGIIARWSTAGGTPTILGDAHGWVVAMETTKDGRLVAAGHAGSLTHKKGFVWVVPEHGPTTKAAVDEDVHAMDVDPSGRTVVTAGPSGVITIWALRSDTLKPVGHIEPVPASRADREVFALALDPSGESVAAGTASGRVTVYDLKSGRPLATTQAHDGAVTDAAFTPDGSTLITSGNDRLVRLWDAKTLAPSGVLPHPVRVRALAVSPSGVLAATIDNAGVGRVWDLPTQEITATLLGHERWGTDIAFVNDTEVVTSSADATARVWSVGSAAATETYHVQPTDGMPSAAVVNGQRIAVPGPGGGVILIDRANGTTKILRPTDPLERTVAVAASPDGSSIVSVHEKGSIALWDVAAGTERVLESDHGTWYPVGVTFSASGNQVFAFGYDDYSGGFFMSNGQIPDPPGSGVFIDLRSGTVTHVHDDAAIDSGSISPDAAFMATSSNLVGLVRDTVHADRIEFIAQPTSWVEANWSAVAFSPDSSLLAFSEPQGVLALYDGSDLRHGSASTPISRLRTGHSALTSIAFSPDGATMATAGVDGTVRLWTAGPHPTLITVLHAGSSQQGLAGVKFAQPDVFGPVSVSFDGNDEVLVATASGLVRVYTCPVCVSPDRLLRLGEGQMDAATP